MVMKKSSNIPRPWVATISYTIFLLVTCIHWDSDVPYDGLKN